MAIQLRALTWDDLRGCGPARPLANAFARTEAGRGVEVDWDVQPLGGFESASLVEHAHRYDVMVIDHPHVIEAASVGALAAIDLNSADDYIGPCLGSYRWQGRQWAAPVDAACHVAAYRQDRMTPPTTWRELFEPSNERTRFGLPLCGVHALMALMTLLASMGVAFNAETAERQPRAGFPDESRLLPALKLLFDISTVCVPESLKWNPINALSALAAGDCDCLPLTFGYAHFQRQGIRFGGIPAIDEHLPRPVLGGTGMAVSALRPNMEAAMAFARFDASAEVQVSLWPQHGGQPAHREAWRQLAVFDPFYRDTASSLEAAFVRPRFVGWNRFQTDAGNAIQQWLSDGGEINAMAARLQDLWFAATKNCTSDN